MNLGTKPSFVRSNKTLFVIFAALLLLLQASVPFATLPTELPILGGGGSEPMPYGEDFALRIPSIDLDVAIWEAYVRGNTWDFSSFTQQAAHLQLTALPGQGSNVVIGAHYELADFVPGPFINLDEVPVGEEILVSFQGKTFVYEVTNTMIVRPENIEVAYRTGSEVLTLLTCYGYSPNNDVYAQRYVVRAALVEVR